MHTHFKHALIKNMNAFRCMCVIGMERNTLLKNKVFIHPSLYFESDMFLPVQSFPNAVKPA